MSKGKNMRNERLKSVSERDKEQKIKRMTKVKTRGFHE